MEPVACTSAESSSSAAFPTSLRKIVQSSQYYEEFRYLNAKPAITSRAESSSSAALPASLRQIVQSSEQYEECPHLNAKHASTSRAESSSYATLSASLRQIVQSNQQYKECPHLNAKPATAHDIFFSHSGPQKCFVKELYKNLNRNFSTFLDVTYHSLPLGENFPEVIFSAAHNCKLAVVVLSKEFVCSKWPMLELSACVDAGVKILPLFFMLSLSDLKNKCNLTKWGTTWENFAKEDPRIVVSKWEMALKRLASQNGLVFDAAIESELTYLERIVSKISQIVPPAIKYDTHHVQGKNRLCKVILAKFKEMDSHKILQHDGPTLPSHADLPTVAQSKVLGLYGLPGSGKSTLCKLLKDHFFPIYAGKVLYLELPTNPSRAELINKFKMLLFVFTDFRDRINLEYEDLQLEQVEWLLRCHQLRRCSVFLVVDNISDKSWEAVQRILHVGFGPDSKILLVSRTLDILLPILNSLKGGHHCICDSMQMPNIDEWEAKEILIQTARAGSVDLDGYVTQQHLTPEQTEIVLRIVRMCGFGGENSVVYIPLVMKTMGCMLVKYKGDLKEWGSDLERFWTGVKTYKEDAVKELVEESFKTLPNEELQVLFMDVALFVVPSKLEGLHEVCSLLGSMHDKSESRMEKMLKDLERYCFLTVSEDGVSVHDVYLDFAKSMPGFMKWSWRNEIYTDGGALLLKEDQTTKGEHQLRTIILEVEGCKKVELQSLSGLKAVVARGSKSLRVLRFAGLSSLVSLEIVRCASLQRLECSDNDYISLRNVKRLIVELQSKGERSMLQHVQEWEQVPYLRSFIYLLQRVIAPAKNSNVLDIGNIARHMRGLQVLSLEETGIRRLDDMSNYWPQLQDLRIKEYCLESLVVGNLQKLKRFHFDDGVIRTERWWGDFYCRVSERWSKCRGGNPRFRLQSKNLLQGCPELEQVVIRSALFEDSELGTLPQNLLALELSCFNTATKLPDLTSLSHRLERLALHSCENLERVDILVGFRNLKDLELWDCLNVVEVSGLGLLASLHRLCVFGCPKLRALVGLNNLTSLEHLQVDDCENLKNLVSAEFENLMKLKTLWFPLSSEQSRCISLENLRNVEILGVDFGSGTAIKKRGGLFQGLESLVKLQALWLRGGVASASNEISLLDLSSLVGLVLADDKTLSSSLSAIWRLSLDHWPQLAGIDGMQHLLTLTCLELTKLENLRSLPGLECLINLYHLSLENCPLLAELPSLHALVNMRWLRIRNCPKIKAVEGCNEMKGLRRAGFDGCESMSCLPFSDLDMLRDQHLKLSFRGCKFAKNMERGVAWAVEEETPRPLRLASLCNLVWEYYQNEEEKERAVEAFFPRLFDRFLPDGDDRINFQGLLSHLQQEWSAVQVNYPTFPQFPGAAALELERKLRGKPKRDLLQNFQMHKLALLYFLDDEDVTNILSDHYYCHQILSLLV